MAYILAKILPVKFIYCMYRCEMEYDVICMHMNHLL